MGLSRKIASLCLMFLLALSLSGCAGGLFFGLFGNGGGYGNAGEYRRPSGVDGDSAGYAPIAEYYEIVVGFTCPDDSDPGYRRKIAKDYYGGLVLEDACTHEISSPSQLEVTTLLYGLVLRYSDGGLFEKRDAAPEANGHALELVCQDAGDYAVPGIAIWATPGVTDRAAKLWRESRTDSYSVAKSLNGNTVAYVGGSFNLSVNLAPSVPQGTLTSPTSATLDCYKPKP